MRVLDFAHAADHLSALLETIGKEGFPLVPKLRERVLHLLKHRGPGQILKQGLPIGSGMVESANKLVVEARLKGAGMHWARKNVNAILTLRNGVCSDRWQATWQEAETALSQQRTRHRQDEAQYRVEKRLLRHNPLLLTSPSLPPPPPPIPDPLLTAPAVHIRSGSSRPSAHHPWRRPFKPGQTPAQKDDAKM